MCLFENGLKLREVEWLGQEVVHTAVQSLPLCETVRIGGHADDDQFIPLISSISSISFIPLIPLILVVPPYVTTNGI